MAPTYVFNIIYVGSMFSITEGLDLVIAAIDRAGYNGRIKLAIDVSATDFCVGKDETMKFLSSIYP
jgi:enolase